MNAHQSRVVWTTLATAKSTAHFIREKVSRSIVLGITTAILLVAQNAKAIDRSWDDAGGSVSKLWSDFGNWNPDGNSSGDDIFIGNLAGAANDRTIYDTGDSINSLTITNGAEVVNSTDEGATSGLELLVNGATSVSGSGSSITVYPSNSDGLDTNTLSIGSRASVILDSTTAQGTAVLEVDGGFGGTANLTIQSGGTLMGTGRIDLESSLLGPTTLLVNNGVITAATYSDFGAIAPMSYTLQITANDVNAQFDWDGFGHGSLQANANQTLDIDVSPGDDAFSGTINLESGSTIDIEHAWELDRGTINADTEAYGVDADYGLRITLADPTPGAAAHIAGNSLAMTGGTINIDDSWDSLQIDSQLTSTDGTIANSGTVIFNNTATIGEGTDFQMNGNSASITVNDGVTVGINDADFNLDGAGDSNNVITVNDGAHLDLNVDFATADVSIDGTVNLNGGELKISNTNGASVRNYWGIDSKTVVNVHDTGSELDGDHLKIFGTIGVNADATLRIHTTSTAFLSSADINVAAGAMLTVNGPSSYETGALIEGDGTFDPGTATIGVDAMDTEDAIWATASVNYDGTSANNHTINANSSLTVNADSIEENSIDGIDNTTTIEDGAVLTFNLTDGASVKFDPDSHIIYNGDPSLDTFLGASSSPIEFQGTMTVNGDGRAEPLMHFEDGAVVNINDVDQRLRLAGGNQVPGDTNTINNATINGPGILQLSHKTALRGNGEIGAVIDDMGSAELIAEGGTLTISGSIVDIGRLGTNGADSVLNVSNPWSTSATGEVRLNRGQIEGATIFNDGAEGIAGHGTVTAAIRNDTIIAADVGRVLAVDNFLNDWDGPSNSGTLKASSWSQLELNDDASFLFNGTVKADSNGTVFANGFELEFEPASNLILNGGEYTSTHATKFGGTITTGAGTTSTIEIPSTATIESGSTNILNGDLLLENFHTIVQANATFAGGGAMINSPASTLTLLDGADVDVLIDNQGALILGSSPGQVTGLDFQQSDSGYLAIELQGTGLNDFDRMSLTSVAALNGQLNVSLIDGFEPVLGDTFAILSAPGGVVGTFATEDIPTFNDLTLDVIYNSTNVLLEVIYAFTLVLGDANNDLQVTGADIIAVQQNFGNIGPPFDGTMVGDANDDGQVTGSDIIVVQQNFGNTVEPSIVVLPEPTTAAMFLLAGLAASIGRQR